MMSLFSMASMTDVIFLLLIFFMVTSTYVFPTALEIDLPQSSTQTALKPSMRVYIDRDMKIYVSTTETDPQPVEIEQLTAFLRLTAQNESIEEGFIAIYADSEVPYGKLVEVLDMGTRNGLKMVLATKPAPGSAMPAVE